ncbi:hypothetical protein BBJ29_000301 [Phytophthora kernoviae]|uniref:SH3 domain-containing protein n=1 Tax=Phytophthora kernoviae TaxID=325452 RepID=A0A3F2S041_9STRA|nr:hypothetical protein BBJ29_000301 [Phytophthora kernoviae]RLN67724.1 hypothetical protein BBP00_00001437 [Phytophthora kernoviae]
MQVIALFDYEPEHELGFRKGDVLRVLYVQDDGWWAGYNVDNVDIVGLFPSNYVQAQRVPILPQPKTAVVDAATTPRPPASSRQRIQQERRAIEPPELDNEEDEVPELRGEYRGHIGTVHQLRENLQEAELASEAVRDARRQVSFDKKLSLSV